MMILRDGKLFMYADILYCEQPDDVAPMIKQLSDDLGAFFTVMPIVKQWRVKPFIGAAASFEDGSYGISVVARGVFE